MSIERGIVQKIEDEWAWVLAQRKGACDTCGHKGACHMVDGSDQMVVKAMNTAHAQIGDEVEIFLSTKSHLKTVFMVYMVPVLGLLVGAISAKNLSVFFGLNVNLGMVLFPILGLVLAFLLVRLFEARMKARRELIPIVSRVIRRSIPAASNPQTQATSYASGVSGGGKP
jgi:sigma-E factor negative regulatory protein RseC